MTKPHAEIRKIAPYSYADSENFNASFREIDVNMDYLDDQIGEIADHLNSWQIEQNFLWQKQRRGPVFPDVVIGKDISGVETQSTHTHTIEQFVAEYTPTLSGSHHIGILEGNHTVSQDLTFTGNIQISAENPAALLDLGNTRSLEFSGDVSGTLVVKNAAANSIKISGRAFGLNLISDSDTCLQFSGSGIIIHNGRILSGQLAASNQELTTKEQLDQAIQGLTDSLNSHTHGYLSNSATSEQTVSGSAIRVQSTQSSAYFSIAYNETDNSLDFVFEPNS